MRIVVSTMEKRRVIFFVTLSANAASVLKQALDLAVDHDVKIFFDLDGARVLDKRYLAVVKKTEARDLGGLLHSAVNCGIKLFGCQMNVMHASGMQCIEGVELAGVATFLDFAYDADAILSY